MSENKEANKVNAEVIAVFPNKVKISVDDLAKFCESEDKLRVGSYLQIADNENAILLSMIENYSIEVSDAGKRKYIIEAIPLGTIVNGEFKRGGDSLAIPPKEVKPAKLTDINTLYHSSIKQHERFCFSKLSQENSIDVPVNGNRFFNKHIAVVGSTGSGKSCAVVKIIENAINEKKETYQGLNNSHIVIFDIHSEYQSAFPNANRIGIEDLILPYWLLNSEELEELFLESGDNNNYNQSSVLRSVIIQNKKYNNPTATKVYFDSPLKFDITQVLNCLVNLKNETVNGENENIVQIKEATNTFTTNEEKLNFYFIDKYEYDPIKRASQGNAGITRGTYADGKLDKFVYRLENKIKSERLKFLFGEESKQITFEQTLQQFLGYKEGRGQKANVTIIDLSGIPSEVLSITVSLVTRLLFEYGYYYKKYKKTNDTPLLLVYEEAHKYVPKSDLAKFKASKEAIEKVAKEGRKYGVCLLIASQRPSEISETTFSQCNNFIAMRLTNPDDQNYVKRLLPDTLGSLTDTLPSLQAREALLIGESAVVPSLVVINECENPPSSNDIMYLDIWKEQWKKVDFKKVTKRWAK